VFPREASPDLGLLILVYDRVPRTQIFSIWAVGKESGLTEPSHQMLIPRPSLRTMAEAEDTKLDFCGSGFARIVELVHTIHLHIYGCSHWL
jgi:hypothetical protein